MREARARRTPCALACVLLSLPGGAQEREDFAFDTSPTIEVADIRGHVERLAADAMLGRYARGPGGERAARYLEHWFHAVGLLPAGDVVDGVRGYRQAVEPGLSPNLVGVLRGPGAGFLLVGAHYDHLEPLSAGASDEPPVDRIFNGADDNASGVAALLEVAQALAKAGTWDGPSILFVAFTAEEQGLRGSRHFVAHPPIALGHLRGMLNMDMVSRGREDLLFAETNEAGAPLLAALRRANASAGGREGQGVELRVGEHPRWLYQSDQLPFHEAGLPVLYLGVEDHADYHRVSDHADRILPELVRRTAELVRGTLRELATASAESAGDAGEGGR